MNQALKMVVALMGVVSLVASAPLFETFLNRPVEAHLALRAGAPTVAAYAPAPAPYYASAPAAYAPAAASSPLDAASLLAPLLGFAPKTFNFGLGGGYGPTYAKGHGFFDAQL